MKAKRLVLLVVTAALVLPALALAADSPSPAAAACKAEYLQLGSDAFKAKYGATEPYQACLAAHGGTTTTPPTTTTPAPVPTGPEGICKAEYLQLGADAFKARYGASEPYSTCLTQHGGSTAPPTTTAPAPPPTGPEAACKAEYLQLGPTAFKTKYGATETFGACVKAHATGTGDTKHTATKKPAGVTLTIAQALCSTEAKSIGRDAFQAKYGAGSSGLAACVKAQATNAVAIAVACKASFGGSGDAFKQRVLAALKTARSR